MAKSLRSKTKRTYRNKKREEGVYAATEAARLHRLNSKLMAVAKGVEADDDDSMAQDGETGEADPLGWCWFATLGVLDADDLTAERLGSLTQARKWCSPGAL
jgi:hypothetical protein